MSSFRTPYALSLLAFLALASTGCSDEVSRMIKEQCKDYKACDPTGFAAYYDSVSSCEEFLQAEADEDSEACLNASTALWDCQSVYPACDNYDEEACPDEQEAYLENCSIPGL